MCSWNWGTKPHLVRSANFWVFREVRVSYVRDGRLHSAPPILYLWRTLPLRKTCLYYKNLFVCFKLACSLLSFISCSCIFLNQLFKNHFLDIQAVANFSLLQTLPWETSLYIHVCIFVQLYLRINSYKWNPISK